ncbi:MAG TPA: tetratricopeptide repeat protein, partial [Bryobacteraceae bacterium]|nr:tetratricopeptide repeat protein [Bryobacteraceae bacterium]
LLNLAAVYMAQRRFTDTARLYQRALPLRERAVGSEHLKLAEALEHYAGVLRKLEEYAEAEKAEVRATGIRVRKAVQADRAALRIDDGAGR